MINNYKATKEQMLMKKLRRYNVNVDELIDSLKHNNISKDRFVGTLAALVKKYEISKNHAQANNMRVR